jgi:uncharacterized protein (DUF924 family)
MTELDHPIVGQVLEFWFGPLGTPEYGRDRKRWWKKDPAFDAEVRARFLGDCERAAAGGLDALAGAARDCVALVIVLDQFPRNMFRGDARAFATDAKALSIAKRALAAGFDGKLLPAERGFLYMPFQHSEDLADQERSVALFRELNFGEQLDFAQRHRDIVRRFGRFPHRNHILGRAGTADEIEFLTEPGSSF